MPNSSSSPAEATAVAPISPFGTTPEALHDIAADVEHGAAALHGLGGVKGLAKKLKTNLNKGLSVASTVAVVGHQHQQQQKEEEVQARRRFFGENVLPEEEEATFWSFVSESLEDRMLQVLIVSAVLSLCLGLLIPSHETGLVDYMYGWVDGAAILLSVCLVTAVTSVNNYQKEQKFKELSASRPAKTVRVIRNGGVEQEVLDTELLVGDLLLVSSGDVLNVDGVVLRASQLKVDESAMTGENNDVHKAAYDDCEEAEEEEVEEEEAGARGGEKPHAHAHAHAHARARTRAHHRRSRTHLHRTDCIVRSGTNVVEGEATVLVTAVGIHSCAGTIAMAVRKEKEETPLQEKLTVLADQIGYMGMAAAGLMFTILSAKEAYHTFTLHDHPFHYKKYLDNLMTAVTIVVVAVPEGLPLSVTIALAYSMKQMFKENNLVRHLAACETMGGATAICTDKTGTLTQNAMTVTDGYTGSGVHFIVPLGNNAAGEEGGGEGDSATPSPSSSPTTAAAHAADPSADMFSKVLGTAETASKATAGEKTSQDCSSNTVSLRAMLIESIAINTKCERHVNDDAQGKSCKVTGNKTEQALLAFVEKMGEDPFAVKARTLSKVQSTIHVYPHIHSAGVEGSNNIIKTALGGAGSGSESVLSTSPSPSPTPSPVTAATTTPALTQSTDTKEMRIYPFTSARKRMTTAIVLRNTSSNQDNSGSEKKNAGLVRYHVKGASELLLQRCVNTVNEAGQVVPLSSAAREKLEEAILQLARRRLRTLALAYAEVDLASAISSSSSSSPSPTSSHSSSECDVDGDGDEDRVRIQRDGRTEKKKRQQKGHVVLDDGTHKTPAFLFPIDDSEASLPPLTLLGLVGIRDPVRPEVPAAIARCRRAGVTVRMITGDNKATAVAIAKEVGIYGLVWFSDRAAYLGGEPASGVKQGDQGLALEGRQFRELAKSERALNAILPKLQVISRASPLDKQILVAALMRRGEVVAVTGDGTNDAPALKNASVGFSMNSGTEVAKMASDVVILDDNFTTIVTAMKWGRNVHDNISKFLQFQMTVNVAAVVVSFLGSLFDAQGESPLKPVQLLWVNLIMDTLAALALATEGPAESILDRSPKPKNAPLITRRMWANIAGQSIYQVVLQLWLLHSGHEYFAVPFHSEQHLSLCFNVFVLLQLFNEFNARLLDHSIFVGNGIHRAPLFLLVVGVCFVVQVLGVQYGGAIMKAAALPWPIWRKCLAFAMVPLPLGVLLRLIPVQESPVPPPPIVVDLVEEEAARAAAEARRRDKALRPTLRQAARKVILQLRVVAAFAATVKEKHDEKEVCLGRKC